ncbi:MAG TPA: hypothetical protein VE980_07170 [Pyrinomonadaceae bacterium]|nr:hypothetical protein [Pyrinomonadaceae bacterium]
MTKIIAFLIWLVITASGQTKPQAPMQLTITAGTEIGQSVDRFKVGDPILVTLTMTNTATAPQNVCLSSNLYQNLPTLTKDGQLVPIAKWTSSVRQIAKHDETCKDINLPEKIVLEPNATKDIDWFVLVDSTVSSGAESWYESLQPGKYELSLQRRLDCCDGPTLQSNKITFTVVP